jgi:hypothetical protein
VQMHLPQEDRLPSCKFLQWGLRESPTGHHQEMV